MLNYPYGVLMDYSSQNRLVVPTFDLEAPGTYVYDGPMSSRGQRFNRFALSLRNPTARQDFLTNEAAYLGLFGLSETEHQLVIKRDWTGMLREGGHLQAILKLAATLGLTLFDIGAHNAGVPVKMMFDNCPRHVSGLGELDG